MIPAGVVLDTGADISEGFLPCDGAAVSRSVYARLFEAIGVTFGAGDGSTTFNVPDLRCRVSVAAGTGSGLTARALGDLLGEDTHQLSVGEMPSHTHVQNAHSHDTITPLASGSSGIRRAPYGNVSGVGASVTYESVTATNQNTGLDIAHNNMQPYLVVNKMIKF